MCGWMQGVFWVDAGQLAAECRSAREGEEAIPSPVSGNCSAVKIVIKSFAMDGSLSRIIDMDCVTETEIRRMDSGARGGRSSCA